MNIEAEIWTSVVEQDDGEVLVEVSGLDEIIVHFRANGEIVANAKLDRFTAGFLAGNLTAAAVEAKAAA